LAGRIPRSYQPPAPALAVEAKPELVFVIEGTRAWDAWLAYRRSISRPVNNSYRGEGEHRGKTGKHFPTLFPPKSEATGPPVSALMNAEDENVKL